MLRNRKMAAAAATIKGSKNSSCGYAIPLSVEYKKWSFLWLNTMCNSGLLLSNLVFSATSLPSGLKKKKNRCSMHHSLKQSIYGIINENSVIFFFYLWINPQFPSLLISVWTFIFSCRDEKLTGLVKRHSKEIRHRKILIATRYKHKTAICR